MYRIIPVVIAVTLSACSSITKVTTLLTTEAEYKDISSYTKSSFLNAYSLSENEYNEWRDILSLKTKELATTFETTSPPWKNGNQLYYRNNPLRIITIPESRIESIGSVLWTVDKKSSIGMTLLAHDGIYIISCYQKYIPSQASHYETILECEYLNFESLIKWRGRLGEAGNILSEESYKFLQPKKEQLAREAELRKKKALSEKRETINKKATALINNTNKKSQKTLVIRELYLGMPAEECAILLNFYLNLPAEHSLEHYEYNEDKNIISKGGNNFLSLSMGGVSTFLPQATKNGKLSKLILSKDMIDVIFNASSLSAEEFAQATLDNYRLIENLSPTQIEGTYSYGWKYSNPKLGFRITIDEKKNLLLEKIATSSDLTF